MHKTDSRVWAVTESKAGTLTQCLGVAHHFDANPTTKTVDKVSRLRRLFADPVFRTSEPRPDIIVSCGIRAEVPVLEMKRGYEGHPLAVHLQRPKIEGYDLVFVSRHDWVPELEAREHYYPVIGVPHRITAERIAPLRANARATYAPDGQRVASVFLGGANGAYAYDGDAHIRIERTIKTLAAEGWTVLVSVSRRSDHATLEKILSLRTDAVHVWDRRGDNPYLDYVAAADAFLIAKDSVTMPCEALATGKPVYALDLTPIPGPRLEKFERFHRDLQQTLQLTRRFDGALEPYAYAPIDETSRIAAIIRSRLDGTVAQPSPHRAVQT